MNPKLNYSRFASWFAVSILIGTAVLSGGCATSRTVPIVKADDPPAPTPGNNGFLVVYTDTENPLIQDTVMYYPHTGYTIYTSHGTRFRRVANHVGAHDEEPTREALPPGNYTIVAQSETQGDVAVPVTIHANETTTLNLEKRGRASVGS
jgi:hypothetical protein